MITNKITEVNAEDLSCQEISVSELDINNPEEYIKLIQLLKANNTVVDTTNEMNIYLENNHLYEAIVFKQSVTGALCKRILSTNGNGTVPNRFDNYLLPVGAVVRLKSGNKVLIISRAIEKDGEYIEYIGCNNVYGYLADQYTEFKHSDITKIYSTPYEDNEMIEATNKIKDWLDHR